MAEGGATSLRYDPAPVRSWYGRAYAEREWARFDVAPGGRANLEVHRRFVRRHVGDGDRVLDIGSGPGRFAIQAVEQGAQVIVADLSPAMLDANRDRVSAAGAEHGILERVEADVTDLSRFSDGAFDVTLGLGGPVSYAADRAADAVAELVRVTRPGGTVIASVMSTLGAFRVYLPDIIEELRLYGVEYVERVFATGELTAECNGGHQLRMFRWSELHDLIMATGSTILEASGSNLFGSVAHDPYATLSDSERDHLLDWEVRAAADPGAIDLGTHMVVAACTPG